MIKKDKSSLQRTLCFKLCEQVQLLMVYDTCGGFMTFLFHSPSPWLEAKLAWPNINVPVPSRMWIIGSLVGLCSFSCCLPESGLYLLLIAWDWCLTGLDGGCFFSPWLEEALVGWHVLWECLLYLSLSGNTTPRNFQKSWMSTWR